MDIKETLGQNIKRFRTKKKLTQVQLAELLNIEQTYLSRIENGKINISIEFVAVIADTLNVTTVKLFENI